MFVGDPELDPATWRVIFDDIAPRSTVHPVFVTEFRGRDAREWNWARFERMVELRNTLLGTVRELEPEYFLSLDSDILLHEDAIANMVETIETMPWQAVGGKTYLSPPRINPKTGEELAGCRSHPSWANVTRNGGLRRQDAEGVFPCDVIMAIKLMTMPAYGIDYEVHAQGEDTGWSLACAKHGVRVGWDGRVTSKHIMRSEDLDVIDPRCGY